MVSFKNSSDFALSDVSHCLFDEAKGEEAIPAGEEVVVAGENAVAVGGRGGEADLPGRALLEDSGFVRRADEELRFVGVWGSFGISTFFQMKSAQKESPPERALKQFLYVNSSAVVRPLREEMMVMMTAVAI
ncbi:MAG TPA: hypothetical protein V6D17_23240 [Candidatus Obscuribacterales bacterium]